MNIKSLKKLAILLVFFLIIATMITTPTLNATSYNVILGGDSIGLQIESDVKITGKYQVDTNEGKKSPWRSSNIEVGDTILAVDNINVSCLNDILEIIEKKYDGDKVKILLKRNGVKINTEVTLCISKSNKLSLGLYIKDKVLGVGTLTFVNPNSKMFACLGHSVSDSPKMENKELGILTYSSVSGIRKANNNNIGEKKASLLSSEIGAIKSNTEVGVFGNYNKEITGTSIQIASINEVDVGKAQLITVINGTKKEYFNVDIIETTKQGSIGIKGIKIKITDERLLDITGGIIQGMSGSPIVQNGKLVGAVSHVTVDNPIYGYAVYAQWMLEKTS